MTRGGTAEPGATVKIGAASVKADAGGNWTFMFADVADGRHVYVATATDAAANESVASEERVIVVDTVAPSTTIVTAPQRLSGVRSPSVKFSASEADSSFECRLGAAWVACVSPRKLGPLADGDYALLVRATDTAGNVGDPASATFTVDGTAPAAPVVGAADRVQNTHRVTLSGTAERGASIEISEGGPLVPGGEAVVDSDGRWSVVLEGVPDGRHAYTATATDAAGNQSEASGERVVVIDTVAPSASIGALPGLTSSRTLAVMLSASEAGSTFECRLGGDWSPCVSLLVLGPLADGTYTLRVRATDAAGNSGAETASSAFTVDATAPAVRLSEDGTIVTEVGALVECQVDGGAWGACAAPYGSSSAPGPHTVQIRATDAAGNVGYAIQEWTVPTPQVFQPVITPPAIVIVPPKPISVTVPTQKLATVLKSGLTVKVSCSCLVVLAQGKKELARATGTGTLRLKLSAATRKALAKTKRVTFTLTVSSLGATPVKRTVTLKR